MVRLLGNICGSLGALTCTDGKVVNVLNATYGRASTTICTNFGNRPVTGDTKTTDCVIPAFANADFPCRGKKDCLIRVSESHFDNVCPGVAKYLQVNYTCVANGKCNHRFIQL